MKNTAFKRFQEKIQRAIESYNAYEINWHKDYCSIDYPVFLEDFSWFSSTEGEEFYEDFKEEYTDYIHLNRDNPETLRKYLLDIYVEGLKFKVFQLKHIQKSLSEKGATLKDEMLVNLINFIHSIGTIINSISSYVQRNANLKIPEIMEDGFNIIGEYFKGFELIYDKEKFVKETSIVNRNIGSKELENGFPAEIDANKLKKTIQDVGLEDFFENISSYKSIMEILVKEGKVQANTYYWIDLSGGYKGFLTSLIKNLHVKNYYKGKRCPSNEEILSICQNTFGIEVSIDTTKRAKVDNFDFSFIPIASTINH